MAYNSQQQGYMALGQGQGPQYGFVSPHQAGGYQQQETYPPQQQGGGGAFPPPPDYYSSSAYASPEFKSEENTEFCFSDKSIRLGFIGKVYGILMVQLLVTCGFIALFVLNDDVKAWTAARPGLFWGAFGVSLACTIALACCPRVRRKSPGNFICLAAFTIAEGFLLGTFSSTFDAGAVLLAIGITAAVCLALTAFAFQTKYDFTTMGSALFVVLVVFVLFGLLTIFLPRAQFPILHIVYASLGALIFSLYLIVDTQLMMGGKHKYSISPEEYIFAALNLYLDVINIFMYILSIVGSSTKD